MGNTADSPAARSAPPRARYAPAVVMSVAGISASLSGFFILLAAEQMTWQPWIVLSSGLALTTMFVGHFLYDISHMAQIERLVEVRTHALRESEQKYRALFEISRQAEVELRTYAEALESANLDLERLSEAAQSATRAKSEFLTNMSHEIRTPMTAIIGYAELLLDDEDRATMPPRYREATDAIIRNSQHLLRVLNDILDLSKIEAGRLEVERVPCSTLALLQEAAGLMWGRAEAKNLSLQVEPDGTVPAIICTDPTRLRQILINLLGNAIKFTEAGKVRMVARGLDQAGREPMLQIDVIDTGIGINQYQMSRLFQPFSQADGSNSRRYGGSGLGLVVSKRLAEMLGGGISVESRPGEGSTFRLTIAIALPEDAAMPDRPAMPRQRAGFELCGDRIEGQTAAQSPVLSGCRILLAEDAFDNRRLIVHLLRKAGAKVETAENGQMACEKAMAAAAESAQFDVILMDMQMPVLSGYEATERLRAAGYRGVIVALTAHAMAGEREKCLAAGCDDYAAKPIERAQLLATIARHVGPACRGEKRPAPRNVADMLPPSPSHPTGAAP